ncbi:MAG: hypothetical protein R6U99_12615 [Nioella sp.]|uniref:hypothetical protein n=1 Tax=Nioella halotolerans TaxID=2303578 RepID=UPI0026D8B956
MTSIPNTMKLAAVMASALVLSGCVETLEGVSPTSDPAPLRAIGEDRGTDRGHLSQHEAAIYVDPDGCHVWMIDDGLEGYWMRRRDPASGLPVCTDIAPPNSIVGDSQSGAGVQDWVPRQR